jgi:uncharacterized membrane protein (DUF485 family)
MKKHPLIIYANIILMFVILAEIFKDWEMMKADNSTFAIIVAIVIPVISIVASVFYIRSNKL